jgi:hypothetical protein
VSGKEFGKLHPCLRGFRVERKHSPEQFDAVFLLQAVGTHGTEVTPGSDVIEKNFYNGCSVHDVSPL